jgi:hypothetical protein
MIIHVEQKIGARRRRQCTQVDVSGTEALCLRSPWQSRNSAQASRCLNAKLVPSGALHCSYAPALWVSVVPVPGSVNVLSCYLIHTSLLIFFLFFLSDCLSILSIYLSIDCVLRRRPRREWLLEECRMFQHRSLHHTDHS